MIPPQKKPHEVKVSEFMAGKSRGDNAELPLVTRAGRPGFRQNPPSEKPPVILALVGLAAGWPYLAKKRENSSHTCNQK